MQAVHSKQCRAAQECTYAHTDLVCSDGLAQLEASNDKLAWSEHKNAIMSELYFVNLEQADVSAAVIAILRADVAVANSIIADLKDVALDLRYAVVAVGDVAIKCSAQDAGVAMCTHESLGIKDVEAACIRDLNAARVQADLRLNATLVAAEANVTATVEAAAVARQVLIDSFNSLANSALQSQVPAQPSEMQALGATLATLTKQIAGLTLVNE
eukprot:19163-Heterococcus_DN1.PRE.1